MPSIPPNDHWLQCVDHLQKAIGHLQMALNSQPQKQYKLDSFTQDRGLIQLQSPTKIINRGPKRARRLWNPNEKLILVEKINNGWSYREIADLLGRTEEAIKVQVSKLRVEEDGDEISPILELDKRKKWTDEDNRALLELDKDGYSQQEIAELMGRTAKAINKRLYMLRAVQRLSNPTQT